MGDASEANEDTHPESISGMRKAVEKSNAVSAAALEWSVKTYHLVAPVAAGMAAAQAQAESAARASRVAARDSRWAMLAAALAVFASFIGLACGLR